MLMVEVSVMREAVKEQDFTEYIKKKLDEMKVPTKICWSLISISEQKHMPSRLQSVCYVKCWFQIVCFTLPFATTWHLPN